MSCVPRRNPSRGEDETPGAQILGRFLLQSRRWLRRHVKQPVQKLQMKAHSRLRRHVGQWSRNSPCMHTLCGWCDTNEVVQFIVCCATFVLSVGLFFVNAELVFLRPCLFRRLVRNFSFKLSLRRLQFEHTSSGVRVGIHMGFRGVWLSLFCSYLCASACRPALGACRPWVPVRVP